MNVAHTVACTHDHSARDGHHGYATVHQVEASKSKISAFMIVICMNTAGAVLYPRSRVEVDIRLNVAFFWKVAVDGQDKGKVSEMIWDCLQLGPCKRREKS